MDVLYFAFANHPDRPLEELKREDAEINRLLEPLAARGLFRIVRDSFATLDTVADKLSLFKRDLVLFHYSGHAGPDRLELLGESASSKGIAALLGECKRLQLVLLNGCATNPQVEALQALDIPLVIATQRPVEDPKAADFAIQFYRSLSLLDTVEGAFNAGRGRVLSMDAGLNISRGLALRDANQSENLPAWGLFGLPGREEAADWRLSEQASLPEIEDYKPNLRLLDSLLNAFRPYRLDIEQILRDEAKGKKRSILDKREAVLKALPHPISELLRYLITPKQAGSSDVYFDTLSKGRLKQLQFVFYTVLELIVFIMLAQLWDVLVQKKILQIPASTQKLIQEFLLSDVQGTSFDYLAVVAAIDRLFEEWATPIFIEEMAELKVLQQEGKDYEEAKIFFEELTRLFDRLGDRQAELLCIDAEEHLAKVFAHFGFLGSYKFASVKNIDLLKYRHEANPTYRHSIVNLEQRFVGLESEPQDIMDPLDTSSVLLLKESDQDTPIFLNLTPFIFDQNAFDEKATLAKLHFFARYDRDHDIYFFRHVYMPTESLLEVRKQEYFEVLKLQFNAFARLLFQQPMNNLSA